MALSVIFKKKDKKKENEEINTDENDVKQEHKSEMKIDVQSLSDINKEKYYGLYPDPNKIETTMALSMRTGRAVQSVFHNVNWSGIFDENIFPNTSNWKFDPKSKTFVEKPKDAFTIQCFSPQESKKLIQLCELYGFEDCGYPKGYRSNTRLIVQDQAFADALYERIKVVCPKLYKNDNTHFITRWEICGLNERFRCCKYVKGQRFGTHCDARFLRSGKEKSFYTVNIYLNDGKKDFKGGRTCFFNPNKETYQYAMSASVTASPGLALIFNQWPEHIEHNGEVVTDGVKYLMRTDVMYKDIGSD